MKELEKELIKKAQNGEAQAFGLLYDIHVEAIYRFVYLKIGSKADAEDITQQVFLNAWQNIHRYRYQGFPFSSWLYKIAHNAVIDFYRSHNLRADIDLESAEEIIQENEAEQKNKTDYNLDLEKIKKAIRQLPADQQSIIIMRFVDDLPIKEIARILEKNEGTIRVIQHRALKQIKKICNPKSSNN
jgi:RNA polymerase sigma-70 factor (ECF subfamily)